MEYKNKEIWLELLNDVVLAISYVLYLLALYNKWKNEIFVEKGN